MPRSEIFLSKTDNVKVKEELTIVDFSDRSDYRTYEHTSLVRKHFLTWAIAITAHRWKRPCKDIIWTICKTQKQKP